MVTGTITGGPGREYWKDVKEKYRSLRIYETTYPVKQVEDLENGSMQDHAWMANHTSCAKYEDDALPLRDLRKRYFESVKGWRIGPSWREP